METAEQYFDNMCRTCMYEVAEASVSSEKQWFCIFDLVTENEDLSIADLLSKIIPRVELHETDDLPKKICSKCLNDLKNAYSFQKMCLQADQQIREFIAKTNVDSSKKKALFKTNERNMNFEYVSSDLKTLQVTFDDPLKGVDEGIDNKNSVFEVSEYVKTEPCDDFKILLPSTSGAYEVSTKEFLIREIITECRNEVTDKADNNVSSAKLQYTAQKPQSIGKTSKYYHESQFVIKNEPCVEDEPTPIDSYVKTLFTTIDTADKEVPMGLTSVTHTCHLCNATFSQSRLFERHLKGHRKKIEKKETSVSLESQPQEKSQIDHYRFKCDICNRLFYKLESLEKHSLAHKKNAVPSYTCELCKKTFSSRHTLWTHKNMNCAKNTQKIARQYACKSCNKTFRTKPDLRSHLNIHTGERQYLCSECGKSFKSSGSLKQHRMRHSEVKPFECPNCPLKFYCSGDLSKHKIIHKGIKPHICDVCGNGFAKSSTLAIHKKYHSGEKRYKCDYCDMRFVRMGSQRCHVRTHTGEKPYKCKYCERAFAQSGDHMKHLRIHLGENVYRCELCPSSFRLASELRIHFATHKNDDKETHERNMKALKEEEAKLKLENVLAETTTLELDVEQTVSQSHES